MEQVRTKDLAAEGHFTVLVYPFRHAADGPWRAKHLASLGPEWRSWWSRFAHPSAGAGVDALERMADDTYFFLPHVRELLFPETEELPSPGVGRRPSDWSAALEGLRTRSPQRQARLVAPNAVLRFTYDLRHLARPFGLPVSDAPGAANTSLPLQLATFRPDGTEAALFSFSLCWVDALIFPQGVGLLALKVALAEDAATIARISEFLYWLRMIQPPTISWNLPKWSAELAGAPRFEARDVIDFLLRDLADAARRPGEPAIAIRSPLLDATIPSFTRTEAGQVYGQNASLYTFARFANAPAPAVSSPDQAKQNQAFDSPADMALYELATCTDTSDANYQPFPDYAQRLREDGRIALWANWQALALRDNAAFLGVHPSGFVSGTLPHNIENDDLHLYLLAMYQKLRLSWLRDDLMRREVALHRNVKEARRLWTAFTLFRNRFWFHEVTRSAQSNEIYERFRRGMDVQAFFAEVSHEVVELQGYFERQAERRVSSLLNAVTFYLAPVGILVGLFANALVKAATWPLFFAWLVPLLIVTTLVRILWERRWWD